MYFYKFLDDDIKNIYNNIINKEDIDDIKKTIENINIDEVNEQIKKNKIIKINIDDNIDKFDRHFCEDELFDHNELCNIDIKCKPVSHDNICFTKTNDMGKICLDGMTNKQKPISPEEDEIIKTKRFIGFLKKYLTENKLI